MLFYRIEADVELENKSDHENKSRHNLRIVGGDDEDGRLLCQTLSDEADKMYSEGDKKCFILINRADNLEETEKSKKIRLRMMAVSESMQAMEKCIKDLDDSVSYELQNVNLTETTFDNFTIGLRRRNYSYEEYDDIMNDFNLPEIWWLYLQGTLKKWKCFFRKTQV